MLAHLSRFFLLFTLASLSAAQGFIQFNNGSIACYPGGGAFCAAGNIIIRCTEEGQGTPFNCVDSLILNYPPYDGYATCNQTSVTSGDAICCKGDVCADGASQPLQPITTAIPGGLNTYVQPLTSFSSFGYSSSGTLQSVTQITNGTIYPAGAATTTVAAATELSATMTIMATSTSTTSPSTSDSAMSMMSSALASTSPLSVSGSATLISSTTTIVSGTSSSTATAIFISTASVSPPSAIVPATSTPASTISAMTLTTTSTSTPSITQLSDGQVQAGTATVSAFTSTVVSTTVAPYTGGGGAGKAVAGGSVCAFIGGVAMLLIL